VLCVCLLCLLLLLLLLKSVEFDDDVTLLLSVAGLVMGPHVTSESEIEIIYCVYCVLFYIDLCRALCASAACASVTLQ